MNLGNLFLAQKDFDTAIKVYEQAGAVYEKMNHHKAGDAWYGIACAHSRAERTTEALTALERAIAAGFNDTVHVNADSDVDAIRHHPRFIEILRRVPLK